MNSSSLYVVTPSGLSHSLNIRLHSPVPSNMLRARLVRALRFPRPVNHIRPYSNKYRSIDEFNKQKSQFKFGHGIDEMDESEEINRKERLANVAEGFNEFDPLSHPRLQGIKPNSPEWKEQMFIIQKEMQKEQEKQRRTFERNERIKGIGAGALVLIGIVSVYSVVMNYKYMKGWFRTKINHDIDDSKVKDMKDPKENRKSMKNLVDRLSEELATTPGFVNNLKDSKLSPGLYVFGGFSKNKLPARLNFFDGMLLQDVLIQKDYLVVIDDLGKVFHYSPKFKEPIAVNMPLKMSRVLKTGEGFYYLSKNQKDLFNGPKLTLLPKAHKGWFGSSTFEYPIEKLNLDALQGEKINDIAPGQSHLLVLSSKGKLYSALTASQFVNKGQFGLPKYSPYEKSPLIVRNEVYDLTNMNNEIVTTKEGKFVRPRTFASIASGENFNVASEANGNIWSWGANTFGQCGKDVTSPEDVQPIPKVAYTLAELEKVVKYSLPDNGKGYKFHVKDVFASNETSYIKMESANEEDPSQNQELLISFGAGISGQLGQSRYMHVASSPAVIKSLVGLTEYDEKTKSVRNIGIKDVVPGGDHTFVILDNAGPNKDVLVFGDNSKGQFGNGKSVKSSKPLALPKLIEPADFAEGEAASKRALAKKINNVVTSRLQLLDGEKIGKKTVEQVIAGGSDGLALYYRAQ